LGEEGIGWLLIGSPSRKSAELTYHAATNLIVLVT
jgi:hypothetical protein